MPFLRADERLLYRALALAEAAAAFASPNPAVGCVLAQGDQVLGEGAHRYDLRDHAEIAALKQAEALGNAGEGATAYVTLEPCSHHGRTAPCADALIRSGITRCVVATVDPNPLVSGGGLAKLRAAGIEVVVAEPSSAIAMAARRLNDAFAYAIQHDRPFVTLKAAVSSDGRLAPAPRTRAERAPHWLTGGAARADVQRLRHASDALLTGVGTVLADDPGLTDRTGLPRRRPLLRIVLDSELRTPVTSSLVRSANEDLLLIAAEHAATDREMELRQAGAEVHRISSRTGQLDLGAVFALLARRSLRSVLVEAGSTLNGSLLAGDLVQKLVLYRAPVALDPLGSGAVPFASVEGIPQPPEAWLDRLTSATATPFPREDGATDLRMEGYLHDPWQDV